MRIQHRLVTLSLLLAATLAHADGSGDAAAKALFDQGRDLFGAGKYPEACAKLEASFKLNALSGTRGLLGACYEKVGKLASAWAAYRDSAVLAERQNNASRAEAARESAAAIEPRLAYLTITVAAPAPPGLAVTIDDVAAPPGALATPIPVDAGQHVVAARAPDRISFTHTVDIADGEKQQLAIPALADDPTRRLALEQQRADAAEVQAIIVRRRHIAYGLGAGGGAALVTAGIFAIVARGKWSDAKAAGCNADGQCPDATSAALVDTAASRADLGTIFGIAGLALVGGGVFVYLTTPTPHRIEVAPTANGLAIRGAF